MRNLRKKRFASETEDDMVLDSLEEEIREALSELDLDDDELDDEVPVDEVEVDDDEIEITEDDDNDDEVEVDDDDDDDDDDDEDDEVEVDEDDDDDDDDVVEADEAELPDSKEIISAEDEVIEECDELEKKIASMERMERRMVARRNRRASTVAPGVEDKIGDHAHGGDSSVSKLFKHSVACGTDKEVFGRNSKSSYIARITKRLDRVANELEERGMKRMAYRIDRLSDKLDASIRRH